MSILLTVTRYLVALLGGVVFGAIVAPRLFAQVELVPMTSFSVKTSSKGLKCPTQCVFAGRVVLEPTKVMQKTQSAATLHHLSDGIELRPIEMLRDGQLVRSEKLGSEQSRSDGLECVYNCEHYNELVRSL